MVAQSQNSGSRSVRAGAQEGAHEGAQEGASAPINHAADQIDEDELVLKHLNLQISDGEFVCLVGHSGCGKTTTLRLLAGLQEPTFGTAYINGEKLAGPGLDRAVVFQNYSLFPWMNVQKNVEFGIKQAAGELERNLGVQDVQRIATDYLKKVNMEKHATRYPYQLSGGMQQRVAIARALAMDTEIMLFDEPFGALDIKTRRELQALVERLVSDKNTRKTAFFVTHDIEEALILADRVIFMSAGKFCAEFKVNTPHPRDPEEYTQTEEFKKVRAQLLELFYEAEEQKLEDAGIVTEGPFEQPDESDATSSASNQQTTQSKASDAS